MTEPLVERLLRRMPVEQQVRLLAGADFWSTLGDPAIGLRPITLSDGPIGVRGPRWDARDPSTCLPAPVCLAATWDEPLVRRVAELLAVEARRKGVGVVLAPVVNLQRSPLGGRHFECLSEDPLLSGRIGVSYVRGVQALGVAATAKHYVANDAETNRTTVDVQADERTLRELYLAPFEQLVVDGGAWVVMAAYNKVDGAAMTESPLLGTPLVREWGFDGVVVSDWYAAASARAPEAVRAGLGLVMPGPADAWVDAVRAGLHSGRIPPQSVRAAARRLLTLAERVGAVDGAAPLPAYDEPDADETARLLREAASAGMVLLRNAGGLLPLDRTTVRRVAVLGPQADTGWIRGGGSSGVAARRATAPPAGIAALLGGHEFVGHAPGVFADRLAPMPSSLTTCPHCGAPGFVVRYLDADNRPVTTEHRYDGQLVWFGEDDPPGLTVEIAATFRANASGEWRIGCAGVGELTLTIDGKAVLDELVAPASDGFADSFLAPPERHAAWQLAEGESVDVVLRLRDPGLQDDFAAMTFGVRPPRLPPDQELARAVELARRADACVVIVGTGPHVESEGRDRTTLALPGGQDDLVRAVAATNPHTAVVVNAGAPVLMPWRDDVAAVLLAWYPGQEFGSALADVLFGVTEPGGRLPCTWPDREQDVPVLSTTPAGGVLRYDEGLHVGYRAWLRAGVAPAYPFGHGLGYTDWAYDRLAAPATVPAGQEMSVRVTLRNIGPRHGKEVVQVYLSRPHSAVEQPVRWLAGFACVRADAGDEVSAEVHLPARAFQHWDVACRGWASEPGPFRLTVGRSVTDLRLAATVEVGGG